MLSVIVFIVLLVLYYFVSFFSSIFSSDTILYLPFVSNIRVHNAGVYVHSSVSCNGILVHFNAPGVFLIYLFTFYLCPLCVVCGCSLFNFLFCGFLVLCGVIQ